ncbi:T9SS type A sorting domain-containing protein [Flavobacterium sp. CLA17]|uniref:DUF7619 domain-containing protein n=1 Tax=Flavobacterium sp. CLA17 TaxID=2724135 RepID=UPI0014909473|nr:T9SS type A sorting domain-containing protein [Flavobacterium sp. CLA17]QSB25182.1 T9SS type A sorting domain-containing protein [Flavobacterium sp. CLA17]
MIKNYLLLIALCFFSLTINAQIINFSDVNFKQKLLMSDIYNSLARDSNGENIKIDQNNNNEIEQSEALRVCYLNISCSGCSDLSKITDFSDIYHFTNIEDLDCSYNKISHVDVSYLKKLKKLNFIYNETVDAQVSNLVNLEYLAGSQNNLQNINLEGLTSLKVLSLANNQLKSLNFNNLINLKEVTCSNNQIVSFDISGINNIEKLDLETNKITVLNLPDSPKLNRLICGGNKLSYLDLTKTRNLVSLMCSGNNLTNLDLKGLKIESLRCVGNNLTNLDLKGIETIKYLSCGMNKFTTLDLNDQVNLFELDCTYSLLTELNLNNCKKLEVLSSSFSNELTAIYIKNDYFSYSYYFGANPKLKYICTSEALIDHYHNLLKDRVSYVEVNSYCSFNPGGIYYTIAGNQKYDSDNNSCDISDSKFPNLNFQITDGTNSGTIISDVSGNYSIPVGEGTHTITPILENPNYYEVSPESLVVTFPTQTSPFTQNFCVTPKGEHQDLEITILSTIPARPGFDATYKIVYKNKANKTVSGSVTLDFNDAVLDYVAASPSITNQTTNKLVWDYTNLKALETREINVTLNVNSPMETPAVNINDRLSFNALITPVTGDEKPVDNSFALRQTVVGSFDPNDKTCLEGDVITPELIGEYVHYLIRFENTGTYPAENIVVKDMIDLSKFDISTLVPTSASHSYTTKISEGNKVEFIFEKIDLPFNDAYNDGYIAFKIKTLPTLKTGDSFTNEANIYFDYNFPILTNKATSTFKTLGIQDFEFSKYFNIYPNPVKDVLSISIKNDATIKSISVYDVLGQLVIAVPNAADVSTIDVSKLRTGNYILKIKTDNGTSGVKFIKL